MYKEGTLLFIATIMTLAVFIPFPLAHAAQTIISSDTTLTDFILAGADEIEVSEGVALTLTGTTVINGVIVNRGNLILEGSIDMNNQIDNRDKGIITISPSATLTNDGIIHNGNPGLSIIIVGGTLVNNAVAPDEDGIVGDLRGHMVILSGGTLMNNARFPTNGIVANYGTLNNAGELLMAPSSSFFNYGSASNSGLLTFGGDANLFCGTTISNTGTIDVDVGNPIDTSLTCDSALLIYEGVPTDGVIPLNAKIEGVVVTGNQNDPVTLNWIAPDSTIMDTASGNGPLFIDKFTTPLVGDWTVQALVGREQVTEEFFVDFLVVPESPIGLIALIASSLAALGAYLKFRH